MQTNFREYLNEGLNIVKKNWKFTYNDWDIGFNQKNHNMVDRIKERTNVSTKEMKVKIESGLEKVLKIKDNLISNYGSEHEEIKNAKDIALYFTESDFIIILKFRITEKIKTAVIATILAKGSFLKGNDEQMDINEFFKENEILLNKNDLLNEKIGYVNLKELNEDVFAEINLKNNGYDIFFSDCSTEIIDIEG